MQKRLTRNEVFEVWQAFHRTGQPFSGLDIREKTLGGSLGTIYKYMREFEAEEKSKQPEVSQSAPAIASKPQIPQTHLDAATSFIKSFWESAFQEVQKSFIDKERQFSEALAQQDQQISLKQQENERLLAELDQLEKFQEESQDSLSKIKESHLKLQGEIETLKTQFELREKEAREKIRLQEGEIFNLRKETTTLHEKMIALGELQALKAQFEVREKEYKERLELKEKEIVDLRQESTHLRERAVAAESKLTFASEKPKAKQLE